eukprot:625806-Amphidinium_carterae.1
MATPWLSKAWGLPLHLTLAFMSSPPPPEPQADRKAPNSTPKIVETLQNSSFAGICGGLGKPENGNMWGGQVVKNDMQMHHVTSNVHIQ